MVALDAFKPRVRGALNVLHTVYATVNRFVRQRPKLSALVTALVLPSLAYWYLKHVIRSNDFGRWYWNYLVTIHPVVASLIPIGTWGPITGPPRWVESIYRAPWMGEWDIPQLTPPVYDYHSSTRSLHGSSRHLISPVILKLHVFSTPSDKARSKRNLIRSVSPLLNLPKEYRHLVELKFVLGYPYHDQKLNTTMEDILIAEQREHGDLLRLEGMKYGENLRDGKIFDWIHSSGEGLHGGRPGWFLFKMDDDTVINLPVFLDLLLSLNPHQPYYLGTSLNRWPAYHFHFTGLLTGFSWGVVKTISAAVGNMSRYEIEAEWDDDVLTGEIMYCLPSAPTCRAPSIAHPAAHLPKYCDPREPPPWGYIPPPPNPDPRTGLIRYDFLRRAGDFGLWWIKGDIATHGWWLKFEDQYLMEWSKRVEGKMWRPPKWIVPLAETSV